MQHYANLCPITQRGLVIRKIIEAAVQLAGPKFEAVVVTYESAIAMGLPTGGLRGVAAHELQVINDPSYRGKEEIWVQGDRCLAFQSVGESNEELAMTLEELRRGALWRLSLEDLQNGITNGEVLVRHGLDPNVARKGLN